MERIAADQAITDRFKVAVLRLTTSQESKILLAVSGGPDSLAMLLLASETMPDRIFAATVDHRLRPEAAVEANYVGQICRERAIIHHILSPELPITGNIQSAARTVRYGLLEKTATELGCDYIATAHHADDQLETVLMRLARGSGVDGLAGIRSRNGRIIRPLLNFTKAELEGLCASRGVDPVRDPSNADTDFDRVAMRQWLEAGKHPLDPARAARSARALADVSEALNWTTTNLADERLRMHGGELDCDANGLPFELQRRLLVAALRRIAPECDPRGDAVERTLAELAAGKKVTLAGIVCKGGKTWRLSLAPPRQSDS